MGQEAPKVNPEPTYPIPRWVAHVIMVVCTTCLTMAIPGSYYMVQQTSKISSDLEAIKTQLNIHVNSITDRIEYNTERLDDHADRIRQLETKQP